MHGECAADRGLLTMIDLAYAAADDSEMMHGVFNALREVVPFSSGVFMPVDQVTMEMQPGLCLDCGMAQMHSYLTYYARLDPFVLRQPGQSPLNQNRLLSDVITAGDLGRSEFSDFQRQVPYRHAMGMLIGEAQQAVAVVSVHRQERERDFTREEQLILARIGPHLARAVVLRRLANDSVERAATGIMVFGSVGKVLYLNGPAHRLLGSAPPAAVLAALPEHGSGVIRLGSRVCRLSRLPWSTASLLRPFALEDAATASIDRGLSSGHRWPKDWPERMQPPLRAIIALLRPFHPRTDLLRRLAQYGLSPRQTEIAACALRGLANTEIAHEVRIGEQTVRDHFQEIYSRIGVGSRPELLARVLGTNGEGPARQTRHK